MSPPPLGFPPEFAKQTKGKTKHIKDQLKDLMERHQHHMNGHTFVKKDTDAKLTTDTIFEKCQFQKECESMKPIVAMAEKVQEELDDVKEQNVMNLSLNEDLSKELEDADKKSGAQQKQIERHAKEIDELKKKINAMEVAQEKEEREFRKEKNRLSDESEELLSTMQSKIRKLEVSKQQEVEFEKDSSKALKEKVSEMALEVEKAKVRTARAESELTVIKETHATRVTELQQLAAQEDPDAAKQLLALQKENDELKQRD